MKKAVLSALVFVAVVLTAGLFIGPPEGIAAGANDNSPAEPEGLNISRADDAPAPEIGRKPGKNSPALPVAIRNAAVAIIDTGIDETHPDLKGKVISSVNFSRSPAADLNGHGTHIAGIIAGNTIGYRLLDVKVAEDDGTCDAEGVARGIRFAADNGANIINISLTLNKPSPALDEAVAYAENMGCVIVAAAGNEGKSKPVYPAACEGVLAVAAGDADGNIVSWSNYGSWVDIVSPGIKINSAAPGGGYAVKSGTSQAAALVSRQAAELYAVTADINGNGYVNDEVCERLKIEAGTRRK
jgi:subtilisin family serine protease